MKLLLSIAGAALASANSVPIYGTYPGWVQGQGKTGIQVQIVMDLLCSACQYYNPIWDATLQTPWLDGTVADQVYWAYSPFPLPYHLHSFQVTQVVPYLQALCAEQGNCLLDQYKDWVYTDQLDIVLSETNVSTSAF